MKLGCSDDGQAPGNATVLKRFFRDNFVIFHRIENNSIFGISEFFYVCLYANFQFSWWPHDHFSAPFRGLYLPNAWSQTLQASKRHTFRVSAFHRYHWFGVKLFPVGCAQDSRKNSVFFSIWLRPRDKIPEFFTIAPVLTSTLTVCRRNRRDPSSLYRTYGALQELRCS